MISCLRSSRCRIRPNCTRLRRQKPRRRRQLIDAQTNFIRRRIIAAECGRLGAESGRCAGHSATRRKRMSRRHRRTPRLPRSTTAIPASWRRSTGACPRTWCPSAISSGPQPTKLATIVQIKPIYVTFNVSEQVVIRVPAAPRGAGTAYRIYPDDPGRDRPAGRDRLPASRPHGLRRADGRSLDRNTHRHAVCWRMPTVCCCQAISPASGCRWRPRLRPCWSPTRRSAADQGGQLPAGDRRRITSSYRSM